jgi:hypothetical protein
MTRAHMQKAEGSRRLGNRRRAKEAGNWAGVGPGWPARPIPRPSHPPFDLAAIQATLIQLLTVNKPLFWCRCRGTSDQDSIFIAFRVIFSFLLVFFLHLLIFDHPQNQSSLVCLTLVFLDLFSLFRFCIFCLSLTLTGDGRLPLQQTR